jgi:hypothetical protein
MTNGNLKLEYQRLKALHSSANNAIIQLTKRLNDALNMNEQLKALNINADKAVEIQKAVVKNNLEQTAKIQNEMAEEIRELKSEINRLKNGDIH